MPIFDPRPPYAVGTVTLTNGSAAVTGLGTAWLANAYDGDLIVFSSPVTGVNMVASVQSNTSLTLASPWTGVTTSGVAYAVSNTQGQSAVNLTVARLQSLLTNLADTPTAAEFAKALRVDGAQTFTDPEKTSGRGNLGLGSAAVLAAGSESLLPARLQSAAVVADWNDAGLSGLYRSARGIDGVANTPDGASGAIYWFGTVHHYNNDYAVQIVTNMIGTVAGGDTYRRFKAGSWGAWHILRQTQQEMDERYTVKPTGATLFAVSSASGAALVLPAGGTQAYSCYLISSSNESLGGTLACGVAAGGATVGAAFSGFYWFGWVWRIA
jgi:hypothetical protein